MAELADRSDAALFEECLRLTAIEREEDVRWEIIRELSIERATRSIFERALQLAASKTPSECLVGIDVLNDFGPDANFPWRDETTAVLVGGLENAADDVVCSALSALGKFGPTAAVDAVCDLAGCHDDQTRLFVAQALPSFIRRLAHGGSDRALEALVRLTTDGVAVVRDWATFGLGSQTDVDTPQARVALAARLDDLDANTRDEALAALARRHDRRAVPALLRALDAEEVAYLAIEAAELLGAPEAAEPLRRLAKGDSWTEGELALAIVRCDVDAQRRMVSQLTNLIDLAEARGLALSCLSKCVPIDSGGPQIAYIDETRNRTWSFEGLLERADDSIEEALAVIQSRIGESCSN